MYVYRLHMCSNCLGIC